MMVKEQEPGPVFSFIAGVFCGVIMMIIGLGLTGCVTRAEPYELALDASDIERIKWEARR